MKNYGKICQKGKSCGSTCIYIRKDCLADFPEKVSKGISRLRDLYEGRVKAGAISEEEAALMLDRITRGDTKDYDPVGIGGQNWKEWEVGWTEERTKELENSLQSLREKFPDEKEYQEKLNNLLDFSVGAFGYEREKVTPPTSDEIEALARNRDKIEAMSKITEKVRDNPNMTLEEVKAEMKPFADARRIKEVSDEEVNAFVALLPTLERNYLRNAGALGTKETGGIYGDNPRSDSVPVTNKPLDLATKQEADNRMKLLSRIFLEEDGRDGYTGQKIHLTECDLEHLIPESIGGKRSEQGVNYTFFKSSFNQIRSNHPQKEWLDKELAKHEWEKDGKTLTKASREAINQDRVNRLKAVDDKNEFMRLASMAKKAEDLVELDKFAKKVSDPILRTTLQNKFVALSLGVRGTMTMGLTSNQRGENLWNWYGPRFKGGDRAAALLAEKRVEIAGDPAKEARMRKLMKGAPKFITEYIQKRVPIGEGAINPKTGRMDYVVKGDKRKELTAALVEAREIVLDTILGI
jgi:hypothetical protein